MPSESPLFTGNQERLQLLNALRESELLRELSELLASSLDPTHILQILVRRTTEVCEVERCAVWLLDETRSLFLPSAYHLSAQRLSLNRKDIQAADRVWRRNPLPFNDPIIPRLFEANDLLALEDLQSVTSPTMRIIADKFLARSVLLVALIREGQPLGLMSLDNPGETCHFSAEQQQLARAIGQQAAIAIHNAHLYQQAQSERKRAERLIERAQSIYKVAMAVNSGEDLTKVLEIATEHLESGLEAVGATIALLDDDSMLTLVNTNKLSAPASQLSNFTPFLSDLPHCQEAILQSSSLFITGDQMEEGEKACFQQLGMENVIIVPLIVGARSQNGYQFATGKLSHEEARCVGFAFANYPRSRRQISAGQYAYARDIAAQCALAIEKARILSEVEQAAALATEHANTLEAVFNAMSEGITVLNQEGQIIMSNRTASHFVDMPVKTKEPLSAFLQRHPIYTLHGQLIPPEDFPLARALRGAHIRGERFITRRADNSERTLEVNVEPLLDRASQQIGIVGAFRDVTEQVRIERRIRGALDTMLHAAEEISGITDITDILHRLLVMMMSTLNCARGVVEIFDQEEHIFNPLLSIGLSDKEEEQWLEDQKRWLEPSGEHYAGFREQLVNGYTTLVSAEQCPEEADEFLNTMILAVPITHNSRLLGAMVLDRTSAPHVGGATAALLPEPTAFNVWDIAVAEGIAQFAGLALEQARWQQEAEIARNNEAIMRESNALKDEFLAITAHEFRTPLTVILAHSQMIARTLRKAAELDPGLRDKLNESSTIIGLQAHQLTNIVNTFLEVTRLNRGQISLTLEEINLVEIVKQAVAAQSTTSTQHEISYVIEPAEHPYLVYGDRARLLQIFANLLQNAIKYSPFGGPITVSLAQRPGEDGSMIIEACVTDKGIGVPPEAQEHLFERFYRASNTELSKTRGVGLGLYVVAELLRLHNGTIHVESSGLAGEGSRFVLTLPLAEGQIHH